jgi:hypothetical protein
MNQRSTHRPNEQRTHGVPASAAKRAYGRHALACVLALSLSSLGFWGARPSAEAESGTDFVVIVHAKNPISSITRTALSEMFLKRTVRWPDGEGVRPADLHTDSLIRQAFSEDVLLRSVVAVRRYWQQRIFSGRELPPPELDSEQAMLQFVENTRGSIGYVSVRTKLSNVKVLPIRAD